MLCFRPVDPRQVLKQLPEGQFSAIHARAQQRGVQTVDEMASDLSRRTH
jgi:hypothetical protein